MFSGRDSKDHFPTKIICVAVAVHVIVPIPMQSTFDTVLCPTHLINKWLSYYKINNVSIKFKRYLFEEIKLNLSEAQLIGLNDEIGLQALLISFTNNLNRIASYSKEYKELFDRAFSLKVEFDDIANTYPTDIAIAAGMIVSPGCIIDVL